MTGKEIVTRTIKFQKPEEIPVLMWIDGLRYEMSGRDRRVKVQEVIRGKFDKHILQLMPDGEDINQCTMDWPSTDEAWRDLIRGWRFGSVWPCGGFVFKKVTPVWCPLENNFTEDAIDRLELPDPTDPLYLSKSKKRIEGHRDKYLIGYVWFTLFEKMHLTSGFDNIFLGPSLHKKEFYKLMDKIMEFNLKEIGHWKKLEVDAIFMSDDWGSQTSLMISPDQWREVYKPQYKRLFDEVHRQGMHAWFHTCGFSEPIIGDLIDIGLDVINPIQPQANNIEELGKEFGGSICFCGGIDIQNTTVRGNAQDIENEIAFLFEKLGKRFDGGFIPAPANSVLEDTPPENIKAIYDAIDKINESLPWK